MNYTYIVPFVKKGETFFLKTIYPSRKQTKKYITKLKAITLNEGIPYQTYITHVIHKITTGQVRVF